MNSENSVETKKISVIDRILLLITGLLAVYQIGFGIKTAEWIPKLSYSLSFGVLFVAGILIILFGFKALDSPAVVVVSTIIPLSLSTGLIAEYAPAWLTIYLIFAILGFILVIITRYSETKAIKVISLAVVHGIAGMTIFLLPIFKSISGAAPPLFSFVGIGGALIGIGGLLLSFLKMGKPVLSKNTILTILPGLLLLMTLAFVVGFSA